MFFPRFAARKGQIKNVINAGRLAYTWRRHIRSKLRKQFIVDPIEFMDFHVELMSRCQQIEQQVLNGAYIPRHSPRILVEKTKGLCRQLVLVSVEDALILQCLSDSFFEDLKSSQPSKNAFYEPDRQNAFDKSLFSAPSYGGFRAWLNFQQRIFSFSREREYVIITDIANYYDSISYEHLRNLVTSKIQVREPLIDMLIFTLSGLLWQPDYAPRVTVGLPQIDIDAPRVLAHAFLYELDEFISQKKNVDYVRFMDDIDIGVESVAEAKTILRDIDLTLQTRQIRLNSGKTKILHKSEAVRHFQIHANTFLNNLEQRIQKKLNDEKEIERECRFVKNALVHRYRLRKFDEGNGEKILKRMLSASAKLGIRLPNWLLEDILTRRPSCRDKAAKLLCGRLISKEAIDVFRRLLTSGQIVDDASLVEIGNAIVDSSVGEDTDMESDLQLFVNEIVPENRFSLYIKLWIASRYLGAEWLIAHVRRTTFWRNDPMLGRLIGGIAPRLRAGKYCSEFENLVVSSNNKEAIEVADFHSSLIRDPKRFRAMRKFLTAPNPSKPLHITHAKFLMICSVMHNADIEVAQKEKLLKIHPAMLSDAFYRRFLFESFRPQDQLWEIARILAPGQQPT